jgi:hypothetical protein
MSPMHTVNAGSPVWRVHAPQVYITDSDLLGADERRIAQDDRITGIALETFAAMEILKLASWSETEPHIYHCRDHA